MSKDYIKVDPQDIQTLITFLEGSVERSKIVNYIKKYIYNPDLSTGKKSK